MGNKWTAPIEVSEEEERILKLCKKQPFWAFIRRHRHEILDADVIRFMRGMYSAGTRGGRPPGAPERLLLAMLLQVAFGVADHEVPALSACDMRWQMVLDYFGAREPAFSQGTVFAFRERAREHGLVKLLLDKTVAVARSTKAFDPKRLRALIDSSPLIGAARVEDTFNLLGHAIAQLIDVVAQEQELDAEELAADLEISVAGASSVKAVLDIDWRKPEARTQALRALLQQFDRLRTWLSKNVPAAQRKEPPISDSIALVQRIIEQDTEPDPDPEPGGDRRRIREGVSADRLVSLSDKEMRHGRKSKTKAFNGYKRHVITDADVPGLVLGVELLPANKLERAAAAPLLDQLTSKGFAFAEIHIDRGYISSREILQLRGDGVKVVSKPPTPPRTQYFSKNHFTFDFARKTIACPAGVQVPFQLSKVISFPLGACQKCVLKAECTSGRHRKLRVHEQEEWFQEMATDLSMPEGRAERRRRIPVEHTLAKIAAIQGKRARFKGIAKNRFDLERAALVNNYYLLQRLPKAA